MPNQMDAKFARRRSYSVAGKGFTAKLSATNVGTWHAVIRSADGKVAGLNFADETSALRYCRQKNNGQRLQFVADVAAAQPAYLDVDTAKAEMLATAPRKGDPRVATAPSEATKSFTYSEQEIECVNESILDNYLERHASYINTCNYNLVTISRALDDHLESNPGAILNDALITATINALASNKMLVTGKRAETVVPYRRLSEVAQADDQARQESENAEALRRRSLPLEEQRDLLNEEGLQLQGSTVNRGATSTTQTSSRVNANRAISDEEKDLRAKLHSGEMSFGQLQDIEKQRQATVRGKR